MIALLSGLALAGPLSSAPTVPLPAAPLDVAVHEGEVIVVDGTEVLVVDAAGLVLDRISHVATALLLHDVDGNGTTDAVLCGPGGLHWTPLDALLAPPLLLDPEPCSAVVAHELAPGGIAVADVDVRVFEDGPSGPVGPDLYAAGLSAPLLSSRAGSLVWAERGDSQYTELAAYGPSSLAAGGTLFGIATSEAGYWLALGGPSRLRDTAGATVVPAGAPGRLSSGDVDADGILDVAVLYPDPAVGVLPGGGQPEETLALPSATPFVRVADVDGDGCDEVLTADATGPGLAVTEMEPCAVDADLDGVPVAADCDDHDPGVYPGATERCNGVDDDCDGAVDEADVLGLDAPEVLREGDTALLWVELDGCEVQGWEWTVEPDSPAVECTASGAELLCELLDDAEVIVTATATAPGSGGSQAVGLLVVDNVTPDIDFPDDPGRDDLADGILRMDAGDTFSSTPFIRDPGPLDTHTVVAEGAPSWVSVTSLGSLTASPTEGGSASFDLVLSDDDGGTVVVPLVIEVRNRNVDEPEPDEDDDGDGGGLFNLGNCCVISAIAGVVGLLVLLLLIFRGSGGGELAMGAASGGRGTE